jgi:3-oxoacyl-[acyl-carrier protein] reductase
MLNPIEGRVAIVTGGSKGIGKGMARVFARHGASVLIVARGEEGAAAAAEEIRASGGVAAHFTTDVASPDGAMLMAQAAVDRFGHIDILCSNAGIFPATPLRDMTAADIDTVLDTNLRGTMLSVRACFPAMEKAGKGRVIITSSITGPITGYPGWSHYGASKAGQLGFMRTAAIELAHSNITVNAVLPGNIHTEGMHELGDDYIREMSESIPMKRLGSVEDVAHAALFFASDEAGYITGQSIVVDGGQVLPESMEALRV